MKQRPTRVLVLGAVLMSVTLALAAGPTKPKPATTSRVAPPSTVVPGGSSDVVGVDEPKQTSPSQDDAASPLEEALPGTEIAAPVEIPGIQAVQSPAAVTSGGLPINMDWYSINNGGAIEVAAGNIKCGLSIGQNAVGEVAAGNIKMGLGFWYGAGGGAGGCACDCHADPDCSNVVDALDVVHEVNVAFRNGAAIPDPNVLCPRETTDVDCSGATDALDVVHMVNVAFRNGDPATEFCDPCPVVL